MTRPTFAGTVKPFCPCDAGRPEDCKPEEWEGAHAEHICERCNAPRYQHQYPELFCRIAQGQP